MLTAQEINHVEELLVKFEPRIRKIQCAIGKNDPFEIVDSSQLFKRYSKIYFYNLYELSDFKDITRISTVKVKWVVREDKNFKEHYDIQLIGVKKLDKDYGHLMIRPETLEDKIWELFKRTEIDYKEFPKFSYRYFYTANNELLANHFATSDRVKQIEKQKEILIEVNSDILIAKYLRKINHADMESMIEFLANV